MIIQCEAWWPSSVTGGQTDAQCVNEATVRYFDEYICEECADAYRASDPEVS